MKRLRYEDGDLDGIDLRILGILIGDARASVAEIARAVEMSSPSVSERLKRLQENGTIQGYAIRINPAAFGLPLAAWLRIRPVPGQLATVTEIIKSIPEIATCDRVTGDDCFIARVHAASVDGPGTDHRPDHSLRDDQHVDHPVISGCRAVAYAWMIKPLWPGNHANGTGRVSKEQRMTMQDINGETHMFEPAGGIPNSRLPLVMRKNGLPESARSGSAACALFRRNGWGGTWVYTVFPYWHFHTRGHEVLACVSGSAQIAFGGDQGLKADVLVGDVCVIPAGVGHRRL